MPFAGAQIGLAFRNEISPRSGLLRVREFPLAEIEHFCHPTEKDHPKFKNVAHLELNLLNQEDQLGSVEYRTHTVGDAVTAKMIDNETLGYFMARTMLFLHTAGIIPHKLRFRQHLSTEMAHYAKDCWDAEILMSYGWVECVGHADRAAYDLQVHSKAAKVNLIAEQNYTTPKLVEVAHFKFNNGLLGRKFLKAAKLVTDYIKELSNTEALALQGRLDQGPATIKLCTGQSFEIDPAMIKITLEQKKISVLKYTPSVIEPSFGIGRIMYGILEHSFNSKTKGDGSVVNLLALTPPIAPVKCGINPLAPNNPDMMKLAQSLEKAFVHEGMASKTDVSGSSIGKKYARMDEIGVPYCITVDFEALENGTVTVRDRDATTQIRVLKETAVEIITALVRGQTTWSEVRKIHPNFASAGDEK